MSNFIDYRPSMADTTFSKLSDDVTLKIFFLLEDDPRHWARLSCACKKFNSLISTVCCRSKCLSSFPSISADLISASSSDGWASLLKNAVCCPGLLHAGVLLDNSDFGLDREIGATEDYLQLQTLTQPEIETEDENDTNPLSLFSSLSPTNEVDDTNTISNSLFPSSSEPKVKADGIQIQTQILNDTNTSSNYTRTEDGGDNNLLLLSSSLSESKAKAEGTQTQILTDIDTTSNCTEVVEDDCGNNNPELGGWSLYDDLYYDTVYDFSEAETSMEINTSVKNLDSEIAVIDNEINETAAAKRRKVSRPQRSHLASGVWNLSREQGNKLLASRFRDDCLYISEWPGCVHIEDKRNYMLFRGVFKNFKRTRVWRTINDGNRSSIDINCAFCTCKKTWDLHSAFCLKRGFGFHDDGEPVVRAYVCENGHVSGAWTDLPLYT